MIRRTLSNTRAIESVWIGGARQADVAATTQTR